ncbi:MAG: hypothetical protein GF309_16210 [Candidatus Lokiarchaeota archaeon]|nr:hypothetical protein [Candidatus Lokiarchaeota archaeon]
MSKNNYERNNTMVACIVAVLIIGAVGTGLMVWLGGTSWGSFSGPNWTATTDYSFEETESSMLDSVTLNLNLSAGGVNIEFIDDSNLLYHLDLTVPNETVSEHGEPSVVYSSGVVSFDYAAAEANLTLGSGTVYAMSISVDAGGVELVIGENAHVGDVDITAQAGGIDLTVTDDATFDGDVEFTLQASTGGVTLSVDLPSTVGGSFAGTASFGGVDVTTSTWTEISSGHYETSNYDSASQTLTITASAELGGIQATLS